MGKEAKGKKTLSQDTYKQLLPSTSNKELVELIWRLLTLRLIQSISSTLTNVTTLNKKILTSQLKRDLYKDVKDKPIKPARKVHITNLTERHGMKPMILGNNEKYDNEFKKKRIITQRNGKNF